MKKNVIVSTLILSGIIISSFTSIGSYAADKSTKVISVGVGSAIADKISSDHKAKKVLGIKTHHITKPARKADKKDVAATKAKKAKKGFFDKLKQNEKAKRKYSRLPIFAKYRPSKDSKADPCAKNIAHTVLNKKRMKADCQSHHS
jgi:hypothetical protein